MASQFGGLFRNVWSSCSRIFSQAASGTSAMKTCLNIQSSRPISTALCTRPYVPVSNRLQQTPACQRPLLQPRCEPAAADQCRTKISFNRNSGGPRTVKAVIHRFYRLNNGMWIRTQAGRGLKKWAKAPRRNSRLQQHLLCNATQSQLLDKMVTQWYKKPKYYVNDPYEHYHKKTNLPIFKYQPPKFLP